MSGLRRGGPDGAAARQLLEQAGLGTGKALSCAFYGDLFRPPGGSLGVGDPFMTASDATESDAQLLRSWWQATAEVDPQVPSPDAPSLATPRMVQSALNALSFSRFFAGLAERAMLFDLAQVRRYLREPNIRTAALERVEASVSAETRVIVGHSLGSVVAYEALCAHPEWNVRALVTLGSPLGIRNLIFDLLTPAPEPFPHSGMSPGRWPGSVQGWTNVADTGDVVALVKDLRPQFGRGLPPEREFHGYVVDNGAHAHDVTPYLTAEQTGTAIAQGLRS